LSDPTADSRTDEIHPAPVRVHLHSTTGPERGLSSPQQRQTAGGLQALTGTVARPRVAGDRKVRAPVAGIKRGPPVPRAPKPLFLAAWLGYSAGSRMT